MAIATANITQIPIVANTMGIAVMLEKRKKAK